MLGLQTALSVVVQTMVTPGLLDWRGVARVMSENPSRIVGLDDQGRPLEVGEPANLVVVDPDATWIVDGPELASRSRISCRYPRAVALRTSRSICWSVNVVQTRRRCPPRRIAVNGRPGRGR